MEIPQTRRTAALLLTWVAFQCAALAAVTTGALPYRIGWTRPPDLYLAFVETLLFFVLVVWPLFLAGSRDAGAQLALLLALAAPGAVVCAIASHADAGTVLSGALTALTSGLFVGALFHLAERTRTVVAPWYYFGVFSLSVIPPFVDFLLREHVRGWEGSALLQNLSPFLAAADTGAWIVWSAALTALAGGAALFARLRRSVIP